MKDRTREWLALALAVFIAVVWLNQSVALHDWGAQQAKARQSAFEAARLPVMFLYRRALDEEMYFATASAILGRPYDASIFAIRGDSPLPPIDVPADGRFHVPYSEVPFEYPPPNLPFVLLPRLVAGTFDGYARLFGGVMGAMLVVAAVLASRMASPAPRERAVRLLAFAMLLLAHGAIAIQRLDALVALLLVVVVWLVRRGDDAHAGFWAGIATAAKIVPAFACLAVIVAAGATRDTRRLGRVVVGGALGLAVGVGPMIALSPESLALVLKYHGQRGLHVESSLGVIYGALKAAIGAPERGLLDYGSFNFHGGVADALAKSSTLLVCVLVGIVVIAADRAFRSAARAGRDRAGDPTRSLVLAGLAATVALWLGGKVFSPQYLTWALPLAIAVPGRSWRRVGLLFGVVLVLSQLYYRGYYDYVYNQRAGGVVTMVVRLGLLGVLFRTLLGALGRARDPGTAQD